MKKILFIFLFITQLLSAQNTVGTISVTNDAFDGYTLFSSFNKTFLINNCGQIVNEWTSNFPPGNAVYLMPDGNLLRAGRDNGKSDITFGGQGGVVEIFDWQGNLTWSYQFNDNNQRQHHDVYPMPNGNILVLIAETWSKESAIENGRDPSKITEERIYNEKIIEIEPIGTDSFNLIWEWNINDHLVQDFDNSKLNFGDVANSSQKLDVNFLNGGDGSANWLHINSIQYNLNRDEIVISSRNLSEIYIIDHSTTTLEAASSLGGFSNKGGDFLFRWGNPQSYKKGSETDRKLFGQHYAYYLEEGFANEGKVILFNNGNGRDPSFSEVIIIEPFNEEGAFNFTSDDKFGPENYDYNYNQFVENEGSNFYSRILSSAQVLPNGNILITEGAKGKIFEINNDEEIVWTYIIPSSNSDGSVVSQGEEVVMNSTFRAIKYPRDFSGFTGKDLIAGNPIETNSNLDACATLNLENINSEINVSLSPNPSTGIFSFNTEVDNVNVFNVIGKKVLEAFNVKTIDLTNYNEGLYIIKFVKNNAISSLKVLKI